MTQLIPSALYCRWSTVFYYHFITICTAIQKKKIFKSIIFKVTWISPLQGPFTEKFLEAILQQNDGRPQRCYSCIDSWTMFIILPLVVDDISVYILRWLQKYSNSIAQKELAVKSNIK